MGKEKKDINGDIAAERIRQNCMSEAFKAVEKWYA